METGPPFFVSAVVFDHATAKYDGRKKMTKERSIPAWVPVFLAHLTETGIIKRSADHAGISQGTVHSRRKRHPDFDRHCIRALEGHGHTRRKDPARAPTTPKWCGPFLAALAETSNVAASAAFAGIKKHKAYRLRRDRPEFARQWYAALAEGYEHLELETLQRLRHGIPADGPKFDIANALRLLAMHRDTVARERSHAGNWDEASVLASLNAKLESMRQNEMALEATLAQDDVYRVGADDAL